MKNEKGDILYIGKAKDLFKRVNSYFQKQKNQSVKTAKLVEQISDIEYIVTSSDLEALMLETNLIKEYRPKYNILMKDGKNFAYIKVTINEDYPRITVVRNVLKDKAKYFGPKTAAGKIYDTLHLLRKIFPFRNCNLNIDDLGAAPEGDINRKRLVKVTKAGIKYPCLDLHIKRCLAPCVGKTDMQEYRKTINKIIDFLNGNYQSILEDLKSKMLLAAQNKHFEQAAKLRNHMSTIEGLSQKQLVSSPDYENTDVINIYKLDTHIYCSIFQIREGKIIDQQNLTLKAPDLENHDDSVTITSLIQQFYSETSDIPREILIPCTISEKKTMESWLNSLSGHTTKIITPKRGKKDKLLELTLENAFSFAKQSRTKWEGNSIQNRDEALEKLKKLLGHKKIPKRIECYDISHIGGIHTVASMAVFEKGFPKTDQYRHFKINQDKAGKPDDYKSMEEVILRRIKYIKPSLLTKEYSLTKKENNFVLKQEKTKIFDLKIQSSNKLKTFISNFPFPKKDFKEIIHKITEKFDSKRIYIQSIQKNTSLYEELGFQIVQVLPKNTKLKKNNILMVFDKNRNRQDSSFKKTPDVIVIDGGKGQLSHAVKAVKSAHLAIPIISLAKKEEEIFLPGNKDPIKLEQNDPTRLMLQHIRDEAHRFAIEYNRKLRKKDYTISELEAVPGIGKKVTQKLLQQFGSLTNIKNLPHETLAECVGPQLAKKIKSYFK